MMKNRVLHLLFRPVLALLLVYAMLSLGATNAQERLVSQNLQIEAQR